MSVRGGLCRGLVLGCWALSVSVAGHAAERAGAGVFGAEWQFVEGARVENLVVNETILPVAWLHPQGEAISALLKDGFRLSYSVQTRSSNGSFTLSVERCLGESLKDCAWLPLQSLLVDAAHRYDAGTPLHVMVDALGPYRLRWRLSQYSFGDVGIAEVTIEPLDEPRRQQLVQELELERILGVAETRVQTAVMTQLATQSRIETEKEIETLIKGVTQRLKTVSDAQSRLSVLGVVVELERAMNEVNNMTNPARYSEFRTAMETANKRFKDNPKLFDGIAADLSDDARAEQASQTSHALKRYTGEVLRFVADIYAPQAVSKMVGGMFSESKEQKISDEGRQLYMRLNAFMTIMVSERERVDTSSLRLGTAREGIRTLIADNRHITLRMLSLTGKEELLNDDMINRILGGESKSQDRYKAELENLRKRVLGKDPRSVNAEAYARLLDDVRTIHSGLDSLEERYETTAKSIDEYFVSMGNEITSMQNPFTRSGSDDAKVWTTSRDRAVQALKGTRQCFREAGLLSFREPYSGERSCLRS